MEEDASKGSRGALGRDRWTLSVQKRLLLVIGSWLGWAMVVTSLSFTSTQGVSSTSNRLLQEEKQPRSTVQKRDVPSGQAIAMKDNGLGQQNNASCMLTHFAGINLDKLCMDGIPQLQFMPIIYFAARNILGVSSAYGKIDGEDAFLFSTFKSGVHQVVMPDGKVISYIRIWKGGNNQVACFLSLLAKEVNGTYMQSGKFSKLKDSSCAFTFVRDPLSHFLSGYNEQEFRLNAVGNKSESKRTKLRQGLRKSSFMDAGLGTEARFKKYVEHILNPREFMHMINTDGAVRHVFLMSGILASMQREGISKSIYVGEVHTLSHSLVEILQDKCLVKVSGMQVPHCGQHQSSDDPLGTYRASHQALKTHRSLQASICVLLAMDYACFPSYLSSSECAQYLC